MRNRFLILLFLNLPPYSNHIHAQQSGWTCQANLGDLFGVSFINTTHGIAVGAGGMILQTTNGGSTWNQRNSTTVQVLHDVQMVSSTIAYAAGGQGLALKSTNGGITWVPITGTISSWTTLSCTFTSPSTGIFVGSTGPSGGFVDRTSDGGASWWTGFVGTPLYDVSILSTGVGLTVGSYGYLWRTTDCGLSWDTAATLPGFAYSVAQISPLVAVAVGSGIFRSSNGGNSWQTVASNLTNQLYEIQFVDSLNGVAVGQNGLILRTFDAGLTWEPQESGTSNHLRSVAFTDTLTGTAVGGGTSGPCTIVRTLTGGFPTSVKDESVTGYSHGFRLLQNYPNPFNPETRIDYVLPRKEKTAMTVFDILGRAVMTLVDGEMEAGMHSVQMNGSGLTSGTYFYTLKAGEFVATRKLVLLR